MYKFASASAFVAVSIAASAAWAGFESPSAGANLGDPSDPFDTFDAVIRAGVGLNDNVELWPDLMSFEPRDSRTFESLFATATLDAVYRHRAGSVWTLGAALRADGTAYLEDIPKALQASYGNFDDFDIVVVNPSLFASATLDGVDVRFVYGFRFEDGRNVHAIGLNSHQLGVELTKELSETWRIRGGLNHAWNDYHIVFADPVNDRDGTRTAFDVGADYYIDGGIWVLSATANVSINDSDGRNWEYAGYGGTLGARTILMPGLFASVEAGFEHRDYRGFDVPFIPAPGREEQDIVTAKAKLVYRIDERFSADAHVVYNGYDANMPQFEGEQTIYGLGLTTKLF